MFHSARWKAYLRNLQRAGEDNEAADDIDEYHKIIYHIYHSQMLWFTREDGNGHQKAAGEHLERCNGLLEDCSTMVDALEETLANTPKPSEVLDWRTVWW